MAEYSVSRPLRRPPTHPGALMREIIEQQLRLPKTDAARRMKISRASLYAVLNGDGSVTADMALRFARMTGGSAELFLRMQEAHDLWHARHRLAGTLAKIERVAATAA